MSIVILEVYGLMRRQYRPAGKYLSIGLHLITSLMQGKNKVANRL
jgi:hypothetical protein